MNYTTNFNLNKPEGTDLYNHLTVDNPNMDIIDGAMQANKLASIGAATELVSGTVHAITRADANQNIFKFRATGDFKAGDTITVDGVSVNAYTTSGQQLLDDAYVLSAEVICILDNTSLWVLTNKNQDASDVSYDDTVTQLGANDVQNAIANIIVNEEIRLVEYMHKFTQTVLDFNDFRQETISWINNSSNIYQNAPFNGGAYHVLTHYMDANTAFQVAFYFNATAIYLRCKNGTWGAWTHVNLAP